MKNIIFSIIALIILAIGSVIYDRIQSTITDKNWIIVTLKIIIAIILILAYGLLQKYIASKLGVSWEYPPL